MINKITNRIKSLLHIADIDNIDFSNINRNNPPIFGPEDIFEGIYDNEDDIADIIFIATSFLIIIFAIVISFNIFFDCLRYIGII